MRVVALSKKQYIGCMKTLATLILLISSTTILAKVDAATAAYYSGTENLEGYKLKTALHLKIKGHTNRGYGALMNVYFQSDADKTYDNDGSIVDMYSENPRSYDDYNFRSKKDKCGNYRGEADCFNREHVFPQGSFNKAQPMRSDFFHVYPTDGYVNNRRGSYPFGEVDNAEWTSSNGSKVGQNTFGSYDGRVFEPIDEFKGDIARALLYFATRYEDRIRSFNHKMLNGTTTQVYADWFIQLLLKWHKMDPVSDHERQRNKIGFHYQGNRNPFIDYPEFVEKIWGHSGAGRVQQSRRQQY